MNIELERKKRERVEYWGPKIEGKQKEKRRPDDMTKVEWEEDKEKRRMTRPRHKLECLRKRGKK